MFEDFCLDSINVNGLNGLQTNRHNNLLSSCDYSINSKSYVSSVLKTENFLGNIDKEIIDSGFHLREEIYKNN